MVVKRKPLLTVPFRSKQATTFRRWLRDLKMRPTCDFQLEAWSEPCGKPAVDFWETKPGVYTVRRTGELVRWDEPRRHFYCAEHHEIYATRAHKYPEFGLHQ